MFASMWRVLTRPSLANFESARAEANLGRAIVTTLAIGVVTGFTGGIVNMISVGDSMVQAITLTIITPFRLLFALVIVNAFWLAILRSIGGRGDFAIQTYLSSLIIVPTNALASLLVSIPTIGAVLAIIAMVYGVGVNVFALRVAHGGHASNIVLIGVSFIGGLISWLAMSIIPQ